MMNWEAIGAVGEILGALSVLVTLFYLAQQIRSRIESLLKAAGCKIVEGAGSSVTFEFNGRKMTLHRPHPGKEALRYRVLAVREFIERMGIKP